MMAFTALAALGQGPWQGDMNAVIASCSEYTYLTQDVYKRQHCTGMIAFGIMKRELGNMVHALNTGCRIEI